MGYKSILIAAAVFSASYPPARELGVGMACQAVPTKSVQDAEAMMPVPSSYWDRVNAIAAGDFGPPPTAAPFRRVWDLEKDAAAALSKALSDGNATTFAGVCAGHPTIPAPSSASSTAPAAG